MIRAAILGLAMGLTGAQNVPAVTETPLKASGKWNVEFAESMCTLSRRYGEGAESFQFAIVPLPGAETMEVTLILPHDNSGGEQGDAKVQLMPGGAEAKAGFTDYAVTGARLMRLTLKRSELGDLNAATSIRVFGAGKRKPVHVSLSGIAGANRALNSCVADLLQRWGLTPEMQARIVTRAKPTASPASWVYNNDYPENLVRDGVSGMVRVRFMVGIDGRVGDCNLMSSSGSAELDALTCKLITNRARYIPAMAADGTPVPSIVVLGFSWWVGPTIRP